MAAGRTPEALDGGLKGGGCFPGRLGQAGKCRPAGRRSMPERPGAYRANCPNIMTGNRHPAIFLAMTEKRLTSRRGYGMLTLLDKRPAWWQA